MGNMLLASARLATAVLVLSLALPDSSAAQRRNRQEGDDSNNSGSSKAVPRSEAPKAAPAPAPPSSPAPARSQPAPRTAPRAAPERNPATTRTTPRAVEPRAPERDSPRSAPNPGARPREDRPIVGTAVPRRSVPPPRRPEPATPTVVVPWEYDPPRDYYLGRQPWGWGFGSRSPYYYEPNHRWYGGYRYPAYYYPASGSLRLKMKPRNAQVYVDGYYVGIVDDFDGVFQRLHLSAGPHRIEVYAWGYEPVIFDVYVRFDDTTTFEGDLRRIR